MTVADFLLFVLSALLNGGVNVGMSMHIELTQFFGFFLGSTCAALSVYLFLSCLQKRNIKDISFNIAFACFHLGLAFWAMSDYIR